MERHPKQIHVRMSEDEVARAKALARSLGMTLSDLIRTLLQMPTSSVGEGGNLIVIDRVTALKLAREMRRWGHHYNQAVHALNAIAYYLRTNDMDASDVLEELDRTSGKLAAMQPGIEILETIERNAVLMARTLTAECTHTTERPEQRESQLCVSGIRIVGLQDPCGHDDPDAPSLNEEKRREGLWKYRQANLR